MNENYKRLVATGDERSRCCLLFSNAETKQPSQEQRVLQTIEYAQRLVRSLNAKSTGLWQKYNKLREKARKCAQEGDKDGARGLLQQARAVRQTRLQKINLLTNLEQMILKVEDAHTLLTTSHSLQIGTNTMNTLVSDDTMESIEELMDQCRMAVERVDDTNNIMSEPLIEIMDIEDEMQMLMDTPDDKLLPSVPIRKIEKEKTMSTSNKRVPLLN